MFNKYFSRSIDVISSRETLGKKPISTRGMDSKHINVPEVSRENICQ